MSDNVTSSNNQSQVVTIEMENIPFIDEDTEVAVSEEVRPPRPTAPRILIKVIKRHQLEIHYSITRTMPMFKIKTHFAEQLGIPRQTLCLMFFERFINLNDTAQSLHMQNNDTIIALEIAERRPGFWQPIENGEFI